MATRSLLKILTVEDAEYAEEQEIGLVELGVPGG
jgi:hypothetical protein